MDLLNNEVPRRSRSSLSLVNPTRQDMQAWLANLSMLNVGETARQLFTTLRQLADLDVDDSLRYELIEVLRPASAEPIPPLAPMTMALIAAILWPLDREMERLCKAHRRC